MEFQNPWGLLSLIAVPALIALYILKQKHKEITVPGLFLWQKTISVTEASTPWQKLKKNLLFILQLIIVLLLCFAISGPVLAKNSTYDNIIVIIDASASMNGEDVEKNRYDYAVSESCKLADGLKSGNTMSVIFAGDTVVPGITGSSDKYEIKRILNSSQCGYGNCDMDNAVLLAQSMKKEGDNTAIIIYTDNDMDNQDESVSVINVSKSKENAALTALNCGKGKNGFNILTTVKNYGEARSLMLELYCDGVLSDAMSVQMGENKTKNVYFKNVDFSGEIATVKITENDILPQDNSLSIYLKTEETYKILLVSDKGFFIEKIFNAMGKYELYKMSSSDYESLKEKNYDLYIFDCVVPNKMPETGAVWLFAPDKNISNIKTDSEIKGTYLSDSDNYLSKNICEYVNLSEIAVSKFQRVTLSEDWTVAAFCGLLPAIAAKSMDNGQKIILFTFDLHDSNLPLLKEYPILVQNIMTYLIPEMIEGSGIYDCGTRPEIKAVAYSTDVAVTKPDGEKIMLAPPFPVSKIKLDKPGVYKISQTVRKNIDGTESVTEQKGFAVAKIPEKESEMSGYSVIGSENIKKSAVLKGQIEIWPYILILALIVMLTEWWVFNREH